MSATIPLTKGQVALVDDEDFAWLSQWSWCLNSRGYAVRAERKDGKSFAVLMHRQVLGLVPGDGRVADHRNHNRLDNRRSNLRACSNAENVASQKRGRQDRYKGTSWSPSAAKWEAYICPGGSKLTLGYFDDPIDAALAYDRAALAHFGEFAVPNFLAVAS